MTPTWLIFLTYPCMYTTSRCLYHTVIVISAVSQRTDTWQKEKSANRTDLEKVMKRRLEIFKTEVLGREHETKNK